MEENTQLPKEVVEEIKMSAKKEAAAFIKKTPKMVISRVGVQNICAASYGAGATAYASKWFHCFEENGKLATTIADNIDKIKVLEYDNNKLKGEVEGYKNAVDELRTKYDNILATESGHESKTENVWQSGFAAGHEAASERGKWVAQPGAVWVKANSPDIKNGEYVAKFKAPGINLKHDFVGMAFVDDQFIHFICPCHYDLKWAKGHEELQFVTILDESAAGRGEDAVEFAEWAGWDWRRVEGKSMWENQKTLDVLSTSKLYEKYKEETNR